jgi:hypothetical protein
MHRTAGTAGICVLFLVLTGSVAQADDSTAVEIKQSPPGHVYFPTNAAAIETLTTYTVECWFKRMAKATFGAMTSQAQQSTGRRMSSRASSGPTEPGVPRRAAVRPRGRRLRCRRHYVRVSRDGFPRWDRRFKSKKLRSAWQDEDSAQHLVSCGRDLQSSNRPPQPVSQRRDRSTKLRDVVDGRLACGSPRYFDYLRGYLE